ncbi:hypothetical protein [Rhodococcus sp. ACPA1]|uniref:hypothetical protein n=1 Tax=Rhodococcus sp. ACPA1 TaxID=2028572 RepID=UPI0015CE7F63|nr:hypothetical protein [Rhodococcus sp. ACPA1]
MLKARFTAAVGVEFPVVRAGVMPRGRVRLAGRFLAVFALNQVGDHLPAVRPQYAGLI